MPSITTQYPRSARDRSQLCAAHARCKYAKLLRANLLTFNTPVAWKSIEEPGAALYDTTTKSSFGPLSTGTVTELAGQRLELTGTFTLGTDFTTDGTLLVSEQTFLDQLRKPYTMPSNSAAAMVDLGLIRIEPGVNLQQVQAALQRELASGEGDTAVMTIAEFKERERTFWLNNTPIGGLATCRYVVHSSLLNSETLPPSGITAKVRNAGTALRYGAKRNTTLSARSGKRFSLKKSLVPSARVCRRPHGPARFGPMRFCMRARTCGDMAAAQRHQGLRTGPEGVGLGVWPMPIGMAGAMGQNGSSGSTSGGACSGTSCSRQACCIWGP